MSQTSDGPSKLSAAAAWGGLVFGATACGLWFLAPPDNGKRETASSPDQPAVRARDEGSGTGQTEIQPAQAARNVPWASEELEELRRRISELERRLDVDPTVAKAAPGPKADAPPDPFAAVDELARAAARNRPDATYRAALRELLLDHPDDKRSEAMLRRLAQEAIRAGDGQQGLADLDRFATAVGMPAHQVERLRGDLYVSLDDPAQARSAYRNASLAPDTELSDRAEADFWHAYTYLRERRNDEARAGFETLLATYADSGDPQVEQTLAGARSQLETLSK